MLTNKPTTAITPNPLKKTTVAFAVKNAIKKVVKYVFPSVKVFPSTDVEQLYPSVRDKFLLLQKRCAALGIYIKPTNTFRSYVYQALLHKKMPNGAASPGLSMHEFRCAVDFCINNKKRAYDPELMTIVGREWEKLGGVWGGRFKSVDMPHLQFTGRYTEKQIRDGAVPV